MTQAAPLPDTQEALDAELAAVLAEKDFDSPRFCALIDAGANPNLRNDTGLPVLHKLAMKGNIPAIRHAVAAGADIHGLDDQGNNALACSFVEDVLLELMQLGASPSHSNDSLRTAAQELPLYMGRHGFNNLIEKSITLLKNCQHIERDAKAGTLGFDTWDAMWPARSFGYPGPSTRVPEYGSLVYLLHKMEDAGVYMPKDAFDDFETGGEALKHAITDSEMTAVAWRDHCDKAGTPMTGKDWQTAGFSRLTIEGRVSCLFTADYWAGKDSLEAMFDLFDALPKHMFEPELNARLQRTVGETLGAWARNGGGKDMTSKELRQFQQDMPDKMRPLFRGYHALLVEKQQQEQPVKRGR